MKGLGRLNPMRLLSKQALMSMVKVGGGVYLYQVISTQVDNPTYRWIAYGGLALVGVYAPLAIAGVSKIWPTWLNMDQETTMPPMPPPSELQ